MLKFLLLLCSYQLAFGAMVEVPSQVVADATTFSTSVNTPVLLIAGGPIDTYFYRTCTLTSAAAVTPVVCLSDVPTGKKAYITHWRAKVNGGTLWATTATCVIEDTAGTDFTSIAVAALTANAFVVDTTTNVTNASPYLLGTGGATAKGVQVSCNANGTGSDLVFVISGVIK